MNGPIPSRARSCLGILRPARSHDLERLEAACQRALEIGARSYSSVNSILKTRLDRRRPDPAAEGRRSATPTSAAPATSTEGDTMLTHPTLDQLRALRLDGMAQAFAELQTRDGVDALPHADWLALLIDRELADRNTRRFRTRLRAAALRHVGAPSRTSTTARRVSSTGTVPAARHRGLDRGAPQPADHRAMRHRQDLARLRPRPEGLPGQPHRPLQAPAPALRRARSRPRRRPLPACSAAW